jgi:hypothetical protein
VARRTLLIAAPLDSPGHSDYEARLDTLHWQVHGSYSRWLHEHVLYGLPTEAELKQWRQALGERGFSVQVRYAGDYQWQCRNAERSLLLVQRWGAFGRLASVLNLLTSLAIWHPVVLSERPTDTTNRFYLVATRVQESID